MKSLQQIQEQRHCGDVISTNDFCRLVSQGYLTPYDGCGFFHDGECETNINVWDKEVNHNLYPYVVWYNK